MWRDFNSDELGELTKGGGVRMSLMQSWRHKPTVLIRHLKERGTGCIWCTDEGTAQLHYKHEQLKEGEK